MKEHIRHSLADLRTFFATNQTKSLKFRKDNLRKFKGAVLKYETKIADALWQDLHKSFEESYLTETSMVIHEIDNHLKHLDRWARPKRVCTPFHLLPSSSRIIPEPLGVALIMAPWNYPFQLLMNSLIGAISSGCCAMLKPSPYAPETARVMEELLKEIFPPNYINVVQGGRDLNEILLAERFDIIFFTGSPAVGKVVMRAAAENLTKVILELGGKSPCIVDEGANLEIAARRIIWGKCINAGQTCIAPDYLFVHQSVKEPLLKKMEAAIAELFGPEVKSSRFFPRIIHRQAFDRLEKYLHQGRIRIGGQTDPSEKFIAPTVIDEIRPEYAVMQDEIFGPILPVMTFEDISVAVNYINSHEKPLAFYYFGESGKAPDVLSQTTSGGGCINDTLMHITNLNLPFGGTGNSGLGKYHGKESFMAFSNARAIVSTPTWIDLPLKYPPYKFFKLVRKFV